MAQEPLGYFEGKYVTYDDCNAIPSLLKQVDCLKTIRGLQGISFTGGSTPTLPPELLNRPSSTETSKVSSTTTTTSGEEGSESEKVVEKKGISTDTANRFYIAIFGRIPDTTGYDYWLTTETDDHVALSSFLQSEEALSESTLLATVKYATEVSFNRVSVSDRNISLLVKKLFSNMGIEIDKENLSEYVEQIKDLVRSKDRATEENLEELKNQYFDILASEVQKIISEGEQNHVFQHKVKAVDEAMKFLNQDNLKMPVIYLEKGRTFLLEDLKDILSAVNEDDSSLLHSQIAIIKLLSKNSDILDDYFNVTRFLEKYPEERSLKGSVADDKFEMDARPNNLDSLDGGEGKDTLKLNYKFTNELSIAKNFEVIELNDLASTNADLNIFAKGNPGATYEVSGLARVKLLDESGTFLTFHAGKSKDDALEIVSGEESYLNLTVDGVANSIKIDPAVKGAMIQGKFNNTEVKSLEYKGGVLRFLGDQMIKVGDLKGMEGINAAGMSTAFTANLSIGADDPIANGLIVTGEGHDELTISASGENDGEMQVITAGGDDNLKLYLDSRTKVHVKAGSGNDVININPLDVRYAADRFENLMIEGGEGKDVFVLGETFGSRNIDLDDLRGNYHIAISDFEEGEGIQLAFGLSMKYNASLSKLYKVERDSYLVIPEFSSVDRGLIVRLVGYGGEINTPVNLRYVEGSEKGEEESIVDLYL